MTKSALTAVLIATSGLFVAISPSLAQDWSGPYVSVSAGMADLTDRDETVEFDTNLDGTYGDTVNTFAGANAFSPGFCEGAANGRTPAEGCVKNQERGGVALRAGYDWQFGQMVVGVVGELSSARYKDSVTAFSTTPANYVFTREVDNLSALRARIGYAPDSEWLVYATAGYVTADIGRSFSTTNAVNTFTATDGDDGEGSQYGFGIEQRLGGNWTGGLEYLRTSLDDSGTVVRSGPSINTFNSNPFLIVNPAGTDLRRTGDDIEIDTLMLTLSYRFGAM